MIVVFVNENNVKKYNRKSLVRNHPILTKLLPIFATDDRIKVDELNIASGGLQHAHSFSSPSISVPSNTCRSSSSSFHAIGSDCNRE